MWLILIFCRYFQPLLVKGLKAVGREVLDAGSDILTNLGDDRIEQVVKKRALKAVDNLKQKADNKLSTLMTGRQCTSGRCLKRTTPSFLPVQQQKGKGIKRRRLATPKVQSNKVRRLNRVRPTTTRKRSTTKKRNKRNTFVNRDIFG